MGSHCGRKYTNKFIKKRIKLNLDNDLTQTTDIPGLNNFLINLQYDLNKEKGLAHGKYENTGYVVVLGCY